MKETKIKALVVFKNKEDYKNLNKFNFLKGERFIFSHAWKNTLKEENVREFEFVISVGGDGTALSSSHFLTTQKLLAVNSSPKTSEGAITTTHLDNITEKLDEIAEQKFKIERLERIEVSINGKKQTPIALNEVFIASNRAYLISKYLIKYNGKGINIEENQYSSGLIFSTGTGSTAWFKSAGGEKFSPEVKHIKMIVREPFIRNLHKFHLLKHNIEEGDQISIIPESEFILAIDSIREFNIKKGDKIDIKISDFPLLRIK